jgi:hypothetical protein
VKHLPVLRAACALLAPVLIIAAVTFVPLTGCGGGGGGAPAGTPTMGSVVVALTDSPSAGFQHILLNVVSVRLNQSTDPTVGDADPNWVTIPVPAGAGAAGGDLQIDLNELQGNVQLFNTGLVTAQTYHQLELQIDQNILGTVVPSCPSLSSTEGCISYPIAFGSGSSAFIRTTIPGGLNVTANGVTPLVIDVTAPPPSPPSSSSGFYTVSPTISVPSASAFLGAITGIAGQDQTVTAVLSGTSTVIASTTLVSSSYTLQLPAGPTGTLYDIFSGGGGLSTVAIRGVMVTRGGTVSGQNVVGTATTLGSLTGNIRALTGGAAIQGATLNLLIPPTSNPGAICTTTPSSCVAVATSSTDNSGNFPLPGTAFMPASFTTLEIRGYALQVIASGFTTLLTTATAGNASTPGTCPTSSSPFNCSVSLSSFTISGTVTVDVAPAIGSSTQVLIAAEDTGTNNLESVTLVTIPAGAISQNFTINVPSTAMFDLIASAQDLFQGNPSPFPGHTLAVASGIAGGSTGVALGIVGCSGHGSVFGTAVNPTSSTSVLLSTTTVPPVQLSQSVVTTPGGAFSFCVPPGMYTVQRFEGTVAGAAAPVTIPVPSPQMTPCPTISNCGTPSSCPGPCVNTPLGSNL